MNEAKLANGKTAETILSAAKKALRHARRIAKQTGDWVRLHNDLFGIDGLVNELYKTRSERTAFSKTQEFNEIRRLLEDLQGKGDSYLHKLSTVNGNVSIRMPRSLHAALLKEADAEGVSLNQLCVGKLAVQLRSTV